MIGAQGRVPVFAYRRPADLRKGFEGLSGLVREALGINLLYAGPGDAAAKGAIERYHKTWRAEAVRRAWG